VLAAADMNTKRVCIWSADPFKLINVLSENSYHHGHLALTPDVKTIASGGPDGTLRLSDVATGEEMLSLEGVGEGEFQLRFSPASGKQSANGLAFIARRSRPLCSPLFFPVVILFPFSGQLAMSAPASLRLECEKAIAYIKPNIPSNSPSPSMHLTGGDRPVVRDLQNGLVVAYLVDEGKSFSYVQHKHLIAAGLEEDQLHELGVENLAMIAKNQLRVSSYDGYFVATAGGNFEASLILVDRIWTHAFRSYVAGQYAVAIPAGDILAFGDANSDQTRRGFERLFTRARNSRLDHPITNTVYLRSGRIWQPAPGFVGGE